MKTKETAVDIALLRTGISAGKAQCSFSNLQSSKSGLSASACL
jgi:hypothetical protein